MSKSMFSKRIWLIGLLSAIVLVASTWLQIGPSEAAVEELRKPALLGIVFAAQWDPVSQEMVEELQGMADKYDEDPILAVRLEMTSSASRYQAEMMASALGLEGLWARNAGKLGVVYLLDAQSKEVVSEITSDLSFAEAVAVFDAALASR
jgi:hypothetical protein